MIDGEGTGALSFFTWFGYTGPRITAEESAVNKAKEIEERKKRKENPDAMEDDKEEDEDLDEDEEGGTLADR